MSNEIEKLYTEKEITFSTTGTESTVLKVSKNNATGEEKLWLTYRLSEVLPNTPENMELLKSKHKELNPSSGWCLSIDKIIEFINSGFINVK